MAASYTSCFIHYIFSTKNREPFIRGEVKERLWPYIAGISRHKRMKALSVGGLEDHVHVLMSLPASISVAEAAQLIKGNSSRWVHESFPWLKDFAWQTGYGAFSLGVSLVPDTVAYIENQEAHHRVTGFEEEYVAFLKKHRLEFDSRYIWA
jgi:REP element-mobilizing transposase RayT